MSIIYSYRKSFILYNYKNYKSISLANFLDRTNNVDLNEAIKYAIKNDIKKITIPEGTYHIDRPINLYGIKNIIISGVGDVTINYKVQDNYVLNIGNCEGIVIHNIKFKNKENKKTKNVIYCGTKSSFIRVTGCEFYKSTGEVIKLYNTSNVILDNNRFINSLSGCIQVLNTPKNIWIYNNYIENYSGVGIKIYSPKEYIGRNIVIALNTISNPTIDRKNNKYTIGIEIHENNKYILMLKNIINGSADMGISLSDTKNVICNQNIILNNEILNLSYGVGLEVVSSTYCIIKNNRIEGEFNRSNVFLDKSKKCILKRNILIGEKKYDYTNENYILEIDGKSNQIISNIILNGTYGILSHPKAYLNTYINNKVKSSYKSLSIRNKSNILKDIYIKNYIEEYNN